jgi:hypothetical protein
VSITIVRDDLGDALADGTIFSAIDYDTERKEDDFVISYGVQAPFTNHIVNVPVELWQEQDENGKVVALEVIETEN